ncbi:uncharacterized protein LOC129766105 [Toxorhynchites rutilus septentrionalis]|uniref:uncharacterized protein LOC129766105 n=1 Tax=Toxorhynchites rutilus septentrionalis TaxID=329112 RepID=UPI00247AB245|nr:uncharacterized protein LOC129766105 [Toxorhynchites rutilus septentrionalis]
MAEHSSQMNSVNRNCMLCEDNDSTDDMVQCDACDSWAHYHCAVTDAVQHDSWNCAKCSMILSVPKSTKRAPAKKSSYKKTGPKSVGSDTSKGPSIPLTLEESICQLEREQMAQEKEIEEQRILHERRLEMQRIIMEKRRQQQKELMEKELAQEKEMLEKRLADEQEFQQRRQQLRDQFKDTKLPLQYESDEDAANGAEATRSSRCVSQVAENVEKERKINVALPKQHSFDTQLKTNLSLLKEHSFDKQPETIARAPSDPTLNMNHRNQTVENQNQVKSVPPTASTRILRELIEDPEYEDVNLDEAIRERELTEQEAAVIGNVLSRRRQYGSGLPRDVVCRGPTREQLAARQAVSKNLPVFRGEPEVWPLFISCYEYTTAACGFTNTDNLKRLQDSLQGLAKEAVQSRLLLPDSVPDVIEDLRKLFGSPEKLLKSLIAKVRRTQSPRLDRLETFLYFGITVKQLCDHLEAAGLHDHLNNPMLVQELVIDSVAFLDEGASTTLTESAVAAQLSAKGIPEPLIVMWTANIKRYENDSRRLNLSISARNSTVKYSLCAVRTVKELVLPQQCPRFQEIVERYEHLHGIPVVDHNSDVPRVLIGLDNLHLFAPLESRIGAPGEPIAVRSLLGWTIYGPEDKRISSKAYINHHVIQAISNQDIHDLFQIQYKLDEGGISGVTQPESDEIIRAREILERTTKRIGDRFETGLIWKHDNPTFPDSYFMAFKRMKALENRLSKNPELQQNIYDQIRNYQKKGYCHKASNDELKNTDPSKVWYLPLNVVLNPKKPSKVRLVWDAAAVVDGMSLNTNLLKGPDLLTSLPAVISKFRERRIAVGGDIKEMYHQIRIIESDKQAQRFLFRFDTTTMPDVYIMDVATFGSTSSPCSAQFIKNKNAKEYVSQYPDAVMAIIDRHYVDDYYDSVDTEEDAVQRASDVRFIHSMAGFQIRNWTSNSRKVLRALGENKTEHLVHFHLDKTAENERVLGIAWDPINDVFSFMAPSKEHCSSNAHEVKRPTKRIVLSTVMSLFDPMGLLAPVTVLGKMLIQDLWRTGCEWDQPIAGKNYEKWIQWMYLIMDTGEIKIPRSYFGNVHSNDFGSIQLHVFTDAGESAYGCVGFLRIIVEGIVKCLLIMARSKVAPLKQLSIPRLELQAAVLGARMATTIRQNHSLNIQCSTGLIRRQYCLGSNPTNDNTNNSSDLELERYSAVQKYRSGTGRKSRNEPIESFKATKQQEKIIICDVPALVVPLRQHEYQEAENILFKSAQSGDEIKVFLRNQQRPSNEWVSIDKSSQLFKLTPLIDTAGVLRMEGRVERAEFLPFDMRFPVILPKDHAITEKLVRGYHEKYGHAFRGTVKNEIRQRFLIPKINSVLSKVEKTCMWCKIRKNNPQLPRMAALPIERLIPNQRPFTFVGVDYLGPVEVTIGRRSEKRWIVVFTCLVVRAIHLEVAYDLSAQSCIMAIRRFICRRGPASVYFSDNGTNLRAASKELLQQIQQVDIECAEHFTNARTRWHFNPPSAPHMGCVWERMVRSVKDVMAALDDGRRLSDEILITTLAEEEDMINSRPLIYASSLSPTESLSPNHFIRGNAPNEPHEFVPPTNAAQSLRDAYKRSQQLANEMWRKWVKEYVPTINQRSKWFTECKPLKKGDLVYIVEGDRRKAWIRAVVEEPITSCDGRVRQALVRTNRGVFRRPTAKLAVLEIEGGNTASEDTPEPELRVGDMLDAKPQGSDNAPR